jgi:prepilin peptidase CpaA
MLSLDTLVILQKTISYIAIALLVVAAYTDIKTFRIPNLLVFAIAVIGITRLILLGSPVAAIYAAGAVLIVFVIGFLLFSRGFIGGGDVKLLLATILLIRYPDLFRFFMRVSILGVVLSAAVVFRNYVPIGPRVTSLSRRTVPYGVAIAAAGIMTILLQPLLFGYAISLPSFL